MKRDGLTLGWGMAACSWIAARFDCTRRRRAARRRHGARGVCARRTSAPAPTRSWRRSRPRSSASRREGRGRARRHRLPPGPISGGSMADRVAGPADLRGRSRSRTGAHRRARIEQTAAFSGARPTSCSSATGASREGAAARPAMPFAEAAAARKRASRSIGTEPAEGTFPPKQPPKFSSHSFGATSSRSRGSPRSRGCASPASSPSSTPAGSSTRSPRATRSRARVVMGIGMALFEEHGLRPAERRADQRSLADYVVAVNADVPPLEVHFLDYPDLEPERARRPRHRRDRPRGHGGGDHQCGLSRHRRSVSRAALAHRRPFVGFWNNLPLEPTSTTGLPSCSLVQHVWFTPKNGNAGELCTTEKRCHFLPSAAAAGCAHGGRALTLTTSKL